MRQALADAYRKYNPEVAVEVNCNPLVPEEAPTALESKSSPTDVYMLNGLNIGSLCENADGALEPLNDVYESKPKTDKEQGAKTIEELILRADPALDEVRRRPRALCRPTITPCP